LSVLFVGGTGLISLPCVIEAVAAGHEVSVFNRGATAAALPGGVHAIAGDCADAAGYRAAAVRSYDVVCQFIGYGAADIERDVALFAGRTGQYIFISSASAYRKPVDAWPITEAVPLDNPFWEYSRKKAAAEAALTRQDSLPYTIVRPSHTVRTHFPTGMSERDAVASRMRRGLPVVVHGDGTSLWTLTRAEDFAVPFVRLFGNPGALGEAFHITADHAYSWNGIYQAIASSLGVEAELVHVPSETLVRYKPDWVGPLFGDKAHSVLFDNTKVKAVAGDFSCARDLADVLAGPLAAYWQRTGTGTPGADPLDPVFDAIIAAQRAVGPAS
ncbi:MAG: NAD(P)H-binding protein, partial [Alphaproteobacteria bacterium]